MRCVDTKILLRNIFKLAKAVGPEHRPINNIHMS